MWPPIECSTSYVIDAEFATSASRSRWNAPTTSASMIAVAVPAEIEAHDAKALGE
jgi:hypothetical protein